MWKCHKCGKPVYFAERKQSLGYDWHPECLRCEECGKRLNPGQHAEHKGVPYCHVPCYGALFGPQLFGHGTRVESHKSFGLKGSPRITSGPSLPRDHLESKLKVYNQFFDSKSQEIRSREVNDRLVLEGALRVYWGVQGVIHLKEDDDQRTVITVRKRNSCRYTSNSNLDSDRNSQALLDPENIDGNDTGIELSTSSIMDGDSTDISLSESISYDTCSLSEDIPSPGSLSSSKDPSPEHKAFTLPSKLEVKQLEWDEIDDLLQVERKVDNSVKRYQTMPTSISSTSTTTHSIENNADATVPLISNHKQQSQDSNSSESSDTLHVPTKSEQQSKSSDADDEYVTPCSTLKNVDYDEFKKQMHEEFLQNTSELQTVNENTLKLNQPIDPSRINDSLKLYSENLMSKSFGGEQCLRTVPTTIQYQTLATALDPSRIHDTLCLSKNYALQKSESASSRVTLTTSSATTEDENSCSSNSSSYWTDKGGVNRSKSGPNWYYNQQQQQQYDIDTGTDSENCDTLKPSTMLRKAPQEKLNIRMNCYDDADDTTDDKHQNGNSISTATDSVTNNDDDDHLDPQSPSANNHHHQREMHDAEDNGEGVVLRRPKTGSTAIKRRSGNKRSRAKLKRRCSINGHFYNRETSFFTPPRGSQMSVWVTSLVNTQDVINLLLEKYKVDSQPENFALFIMRDNGEQRRLKDDEYPLIARIMLGPHEDVAKLFLTDSQNTAEISCEVAQFLNLSIPECRAILDRYNDELEREVFKVKERYAEMRRRITQRMESLKVRL